MKAAIYDHRAEHWVSIEERPKPKLPVRSRKGLQAVVRIHAAGVNPVDAKGVLGDKFPEWMMSFWFRCFSGRVIGFDFSGVIVETAPESSFSIGDSVYGLNYQYAPIGNGALGGTLSEYALVYEDQIWHKPNSLSHCEAAALPLVSVTSLQVFEQHHLAAGQNILVIGASGGVGHIATQIASRMGCHVTAVCSEKNRQFVSDCGATSVLPYNQPSQSIWETLKSHVHSNSAFDLVLDTVSSADSRDQLMGYPANIMDASPPILKKGFGPEAISGVDQHNYVVLGGASQDWLTALLKRLTPINLFPKGFELFWINMPGSANKLEQVQKLCDDQSMRPKVSKVLPFNQQGVEEAFHTLHPPKGQHRSAHSKVVITITDD